MSTLARSPDEAALDAERERERKANAPIDLRNLQQQKEDEVKLTAAHVKMMGRSFKKPMKFVRGSAHSRCKSVSCFPWL